LVQPVANADLVAFLQALPEGRKRRGVRYPQWLLLLMAILGILSGCRSARDLERFAKRHHQAFWGCPGFVDSDQGLAVRSVRAVTNCCS
jgi:hypothetical protein